MVLFSHVAIRIFDLLWSRITLNAQDVVVVLLSGDAAVLLSSGETTLADATDGSVHRFL